MMCKKVVPSNVCPNAPIFAYAATSPVNQSFVIITEGIILNQQRASNAAFAKPASCLTINVDFPSA